MKTIAEKTLRVGLTMGDPQGVGPELLVRVISAWHEAKALRGDSLSFVPVALGDAALLQRAARLFTPSLSIRTVSADELPDEPEDNVLFCVSLSEINQREMEMAEPKGFRFGREVYRYLSVAIDLAMAGELKAIVTAPIAKTALQAAGISAPGHTEILAERSGVGNRHAMMLAGPKLRVTLATVHVALSQVSQRLSPADIECASELTYEWLVRYFGIHQPRIAVAGLNPHAGEGGLMGTEEQTLIAPALKKLRSQGIPVEGPFSPDTIFQRAYEGDFDAVIAMYHDQGLIPLKLVHFYEGVNITLGLPFVRTSPDHGTAFDLAWQGKASTESFEAALRMALHLATRAPEGSCE